MKVDESGPQKIKVDESESRIVAKHLLGLLIPEVIYSPDLQKVAINANATL